jgi:anti-anti-sigma regulatory factor
MSELPSDGLTARLSRTRCTAETRLVEVVGTLDRAAGLDLLGIVDDHLTAAPRRLVLDLSDVHAVTTDGLRALVQAGRYTADADVRLAFVASNGVAHELRSHGALFSVHPTTDAALNG